MDSEGNKKNLFIRRLLCERCGRIHHELPDCIVPYKRHCAETIEGIINGIDEVPCENGTIQRIRAWWSDVLPYFLNILESLAKKYEDIVYNRTPALKETVRAIVNTNNWIFAGSICTRSVWESG